MATCAPEKYAEPEKVKYIPINEIEALLLRAKHALKEEAGIYRERAEIEKVYCKSLRKWHEENKERLMENQDIDHAPIRLALLMSLHEATATAKIHEDLVQKLVGDSGHVTNLEQFRPTYFKARHELDIPSLLRSGLSKEKILEYFDRYLAEYRNALNTCLTSIYLAEEAISEEALLKTEIIEIQKKIGDLTKNGPQSRQKISKLERKCINLEGHLSTASSKRKNALAKVKLSLCESEESLDCGIRGVTAWEESRIGFVKSELVSILDCLEKLGPHTKISLQKATATVENINKTQIITDWEKAQLRQFKIMETSYEVERKKRFKFFKTRDKTEAFVSVMSLCKRNSDNDVRTETPLSRRTSPDKSKRPSSSPTPFNLFITDLGSNNNSCKSEDDSKCEKDEQYIPAVIEHENITTSKLFSDHKTNEVRTLNSVIGVPGKKTNHHAVELSKEESLYFYDFEIGKFEEKQEFLPYINDMQHFEHVWIVRKEHGKNPFFGRDGCVDMPCVAVMDIEDRTGYLLDLWRGQRVHVELISKKCGMAWGWVRDDVYVEGEQRKLSGKFPLLAVEPINNWLY